MLGRPDLRAAEETLRRWMAAAALVRPASAGGRVVIGADASLPVVQALIRWDPVGHAAVELAARRELGFPPAVAMASIEAVTSRRCWPPSTGWWFRRTVRCSVRLRWRSRLRPVHRREAGVDGPTLRALVRTSQAERKALGAALHALAAGRSARKEGGGLRIRVDPLDLF